MSRVIPLLTLVGFLVVAFLVGLTTQAIARNNYGAIAYSPDAGSYGYSYDYRSRARAEAAAMSSCRETGHGCRVIIWFRNACGALATGPDGYGSGWARSRRAAERKALRSCRNYSRRCGVLSWACTTR